MTKKEKIKAAIEGRKPAATPYHFDLTLKINHKIADYYGIESEEVEKCIGNHFLYVSYEAPESFKKSDDSAKGTEKHDGGTITFEMQKVGNNAFIDEFGVTWDNDRAYETGDWGMVDHPVKNMDFSNYRFPHGWASGRFRGVEEFVRNNPDRFTVLLMVGILDTAWHVTGMQDLLMGMALEDKNFINFMLDSALEFNLGVIEQIPPYIDGVRFLEDWAGQEGLYMGIKNWRKYLKPRLKEMYTAAKNKGCAVMSHSDGNITEVFPDLIELGVDVSDPTQPEAMDLVFIKKEYGKDIVLFGGLGCQSTIPLGTPKDVVDEAKETLSLLGEGGKYILGPSGAVPTETPIENIVALIEFCKELNGE
jgi:uroporphyrinogen decarboxylase